MATESLPRRWARTDAPSRLTALLGDALLTHTPVFVTRMRGPYVVREPSRWVESVDAAHVHLSGGVRVALGAVVNAAVA